MYAEWSFWGISSKREVKFYSGIDFLENINYNIPTIALTANAISGMKEKYLENGFDDYLSKPIEKVELYRVIYKFLNK